MSKHFSDFRLLVMDMDSTLITIECIDEIADFTGKKSEVGTITAAAMCGDMDWPASLRQRVQLLAGLNDDVLQRVYDERLQLSPGAETLINAAHDAGIYTLLVSGGFTFFTERLKNRLGLNAAFANQLEIIDGKLTGRVIGELCDDDGKARHLREAAQRLGIVRGQIMAIGDGANDLKMMAEAGTSIAYCAKPIVQSQATHTINTAGLAAVLALFN